MKKQIYIGMALFALAAAVFFCVLTGREFLSLVSGPEAAADGASLEQMEGQYITYSVAHPVASFAEEYYSGDESRVSKMAYVIYDRERQAFFKLIVSARNKGEFDRLMRAVNRSQELKDSWGEMQADEERPIEVAGSFLPIEETGQIRRIADALTGEDSYGTKEMNQSALSQTSWYVLEDRTIGGIPVLDLWLCAVAAGLSILILLIYLILIAKKSGASAEEGHARDAVEQLLAKQRTWLTPWCEKGSKKQNRMAFLVLAGAIAGLIVLGLIVGFPVQRVMTCHLPIGVIVGELSAFMLVLGAGVSLRPDKILKRCKKNLERALPGQADREKAARELLDTSKEWTVLEKGKEDIRYGITGEHYWMVLTGKGQADVAEADRIGAIKSETVSGQVRSGNVRVNYTYYTIQISYKDSKKKKGADVVFNFDAEDTAGHFMILARKRLGDRAADIIQ